MKRKEMTKTFIGDLDIELVKTIQSFGYLFNT